MIAFEGKLKYVSQWHLGTAVANPILKKLYQKTPLGFNYYSLHYHSSTLIQVEVQISE